MNPNWICHFLRMDGLVQRVIEIKIEGTGSRGRRSKQLLMTLKKSKEEILYCTVRVTRFGRVYGAVVRQTAV